MNKSDIVYLINSEILCFTLYLLSINNSFIFQNEGIVEIFENFLLFSSILISSYLSIVKTISRKLFLFFLFLSSFLFLEEINYGQKILNFKTPFIFLLLTDHRQLNLHNMPVFTWISQAIFFYVFIKNFSLIKRNFLNMLFLFPSVLLSVYLIYKIFFYHFTSFLCEEIIETIIYYTILHIVVISINFKKIQLLDLKKIHFKL